MAQRRILVIEGDEDTRLDIREALTSVGYEVEASPHLLSAFGAALSSDYSLILLDPGTPGIERQEVEEMVEVALAVTPALAVSEPLDEARVQELEDLGVRHFLWKPFRAEDLLRAVETAISREGR